MRGAGSRKVASAEPLRGAGFRAGRAGRAASEPGAGRDCGALRWGYPGGAGLRGELGRWELRGPYAGRAGTVGAADRLRSWASWGDCMGSRVRPLMSGDLLILGEGIGAGRAANPSARNFPGELRTRAAETREAADREALRTISGALTIPLCGAGLLLTILPEVVLTFPHALNCERYFRRV